MKELIKSRIRSSINYKELIFKDDDLLNQIERLSNDYLYALHNVGKIIFAGNGGSFADAQHLLLSLRSGPVIVPGAGDEQLSTQRDRQRLRL